MMDKVAYKVLTAPQFAALQEGHFEGAPVDVADGYIHLSSAAQLTDTVHKHFAGQDRLFVLAVDLTRLGGAVRWEISRGGQLFPHLYGQLNMENVLAHAPLRWQGDEVAVPG
ncbi:MAG TPA: DUF952 domain-containing protein [Acidocella sp.]|jgi:uncharacterized protein (DUF952 family)|nr:DUF952 domain-containing protein [Acidocella sp.]